jgi:hypothetical protein
MTLGAVLAAAPEVKRVAIAAIPVIANDICKIRGMPLDRSRLIAP